MCNVIIAWQGNVSTIILTHIALLIKSVQMHVSIQSSQCHTTSPIVQVLQSDPVHYYVSHRAGATV